MVAPRYRNGQSLLGGFPAKIRGNYATVDVMPDCPTSAEAKAVIGAFLPQVQSPILRRVLNYWVDKCAGRRMPSRKDIEPLDLRDALGFISLIEIRRNPLRFYFRLDGTKQVELFQIDCTGRFLDECFDEQHLAVAQKSYREVTETGLPSYYRRQLPYYERLISYEIAILPLGEGEALSSPSLTTSDLVTGGPGQPNMLMTVIVPNW
jgi:hypothetical protein